MQHMEKLKPTTPNETSVEVCLKIPPINCRRGFLYPMNQTLIQRLYQLQIICCDYILTLSVSIFDI